jgi:hypothetical protein
MFFLRNPLSGNAMNATNATKIVFLFLLLLETFGGRSSAFAAASYDLIVWHPFVGVQEQHFSSWLREFSQRENIVIRAENAFDLNTALRKKASTREFPDVVIGPSDLLNVSDSVPLNTIHDSDFLGRKLISVKEKRVAVRLFENGTQFLLRKKGTKVLASRSDLLSALKEGNKLVWANVEPMFLLSFLLKEERNSEGARRAFKDFQELMLASNTPYPCDHKCLWNSIVQKKADFAVVGDWLFPDLNKSDIGRDYFLESLPPFLGKCASLSYSAFFPSRGIADDKRLSNATRLVTWLSSHEILGRVQRQFLQRPSGIPSRITSWPKWMRSAVASTKECADVSDRATPEFWAASSFALRQLATQGTSSDDAADAFSKNIASFSQEKPSFVK